MNAKTRCGEWWATSVERCTLPAGHDGPHRATPEPSPAGGEMRIEGVAFADVDCFARGEDGECLEPAWVFVEGATVDDLGEHRATLIIHREPEEVMPDDAAGGTDDGSTEGDVEAATEVRDLMNDLSEHFGGGGMYFVTVPRPEAARWQRKVARAAVLMDGLVRRLHPLASGGVDTASHGDRHGRGGVDTG